MKNVFTLFLIVILLSSCNWLNKYEVIIDNPTLDFFTLEIDEKTYNLDAFSHVLVDLKPGDYLAVARDEQGEVFFEQTISVNASGILNPTLSIYVLWRDLYLDNPEKFHEFAEKELNIRSEVTIGNKKYNDVDFIVYENQAFIAKAWDYGLFEQWSDEVDVYSQKVLVKSKVYRLDDLEEEWGYWGEFDMTDYTDEDFKNLLDSLLQREEMLLQEEL
jgi:hypothetical protein